MEKSWVLDSSCLILFGKIRRLDLPATLPGPIYVPMSVKREILAEKPPDLASTWLKRKDCPAQVVRAPVPASVRKWALGQGESEVLAFALKHRGSTAVLDDRRARLCAKELGITVKGTIGLILWLKQQGRLSRIGPILELFPHSGFRLDPGILRTALKLAGEDDAEWKEGPGVREAPAAYGTGTASPNPRRAGKPKSKRKK